MAHFGISSTSRTAGHATAGSSSSKYRFAGREIFSVSLSSHSHYILFQELTQKIEQIEQKTLTSQSRLSQLKASEDQLSHRVLKVCTFLFVLGCNEGFRCKLFALFYPKCKVYSPVV